MRLRLIQLPAAVTDGVYPTYRLAAVVQELVRRQFLDAKGSASADRIAAASSSSTALQPLPPTVISFTPSPTFTLGRRQDAAALASAALAKLRAPLTVMVRDEAEKDVDGDSAYWSGGGSDGGDDAKSASYTYAPAVEPSLRGGLTTYHGPGQAVLWPVFDLKSPAHRHFTVRCYSRLLEDTTADVLRRRFGVAAYTTSDPGLWVAAAASERKIAALGVHLRRNISALGVAVNLDMPVTRPPDSVGGGASPDGSLSPDTNPWTRFVPCGLDKGVTCVAEEGRRRFGHVPAAWDLRPAPFAVKWALTLAARLGLEPGLDIADDTAVGHLVAQASERLAREDGDKGEVP